jgi:alpha-galactosidase
MLHYECNRLHYVNKRREGQARSPWNSACHGDQIAMNILRKANLGESLCRNNHIRMLLFLSLLVGLSMPGQAQTASPKDISGTWIANLKNAMGDMELVYELKVENGKITGAQRMSFGDSPIIDGKIDGDHFEFTIQMESFGTMQNRVVTGEIVGDQLRIVPVMPGPPTDADTPGGSAPAGAGTTSAAAGSAAPGGAGDSGGPGGPMGEMKTGPVMAHRGTPTPSYRAATVDYKKLPKTDLPALKELPANGLAKTPPMGWNSWNKFQTKIDDKTVRGIADAMVASGMKDAGYRYVIIDDGWEWKRDENGHIVLNPNFPDMKALADYVHSKGLKLGIYSTPGPTTCGGYEGSYAHEEQDAKSYAEWGIDYLKYDWCSASRLYQEKDMQAAYQKMGEALQKSGRKIVYALCQYGREHVEKWGPSVGANLWRTSGDISDRYSSMAKNGFVASDLAPYAAPGHWNDPDMLEIGNGGMTAAEYRTHFSLWAMLAAPLIAGNDLRDMTEETKQILMNKEVIAVDQDPLGKGGYRVAKNGETEVWVKPLEKNSYAVALFNRGAAEAEVAVQWADLKLSGKFKGRDLWAHTDLGALANGYSAKVPSHGVVMIRLTR